MHVHIPLALPSLLPSSPRRPCVQVFGLLFAATGFGHHERTDPMVAILTYSTVGLGLLMVLASCVGIWGARSLSVTMLRGVRVWCCGL